MNKRRRDPAINVKFFELSSRWWRVEGYQIYLGTILPAEGANVVPFDPWKIYAEECSKNGNCDRLLRRLFAITRRYERNKANKRRSNPAFIESIDFELPQSLASALLDWCRQFGLMGIMCEEVVEIRQHHKFYQLKNADIGKKSEVIPTREWYSWNGQAWIKHQREAPFWVTRYMDPDRSKYAQDAFSGQSDRPGITLFSLNPSREFLISESDAATRCWDVKHIEWLYTYFVGAAYRFTDPVSGKTIGCDANKYRPPVPMGKEFFASYQEPVSEFFRAAALLYAAWKGLKGKPLRIIPGFLQRNGKTIRINKDTVARNEKRATGNEVLNSLLCRTAPHLSVNSGGHLSWDWTSPSLVSTLALMIAFDATRPSRICAECGVELASDSRRKYCLRCQKKLNKRDERRRHNEM